MAVGLAKPENLLAVSGIRLASVAAGIKKNGNQDLVAILIDENASCAATFTQNAFCAAPVLLAKEHLSEHTPRALLINSGNANAGTGETGLENARQCCQWLAQKLGCTSEQILPFSTGVIGQQLPMSNFQTGIQQLIDNSSNDAWEDAAQGIMTTDTIAKAISTTTLLDGKKVTITGIAKGSGMIRPDMATMLSFIATDAVVEPEFLQRCLSDAVAESFNAITVDGDTSTNDACVLIATNQAGNDLLTAESTDVDNFTQQLNIVCRHLAQSIIRDGEGATKFVTVKVEQCDSDKEAKAVAYTIAHSPLVKTALFASDPNWGRILAAVGRAGVEQLTIDRVNIYLDDVCIVRNGAVDDEYSEAKGQQVMDREEITITVELGRGDASTTLWTSDLSHDYVRINSDYRS